VQMVSLVQQVHKDLQELRVQLVRMALPVPQALKASLVRPAHKVIKDHQASQESPDPQGLREIKVLRGSLALLDPMV